MSFVRTSSLAGTCVGLRRRHLLPATRAAFAAPANAPTVDERYLLAEEPEGAADVIAVRKSAKDQQDVLVVGRIGGKKNPWIHGVAAFPIVDRSLKSCNEKGHTCPTLGTIAVPATCPRRWCS